MKKRTQALLLVLCAVLLVAGSVLGTMAYLTDTEKVTNTFTVGKVDITMDEAKVDEYGAELTDAARVTENTYKLVPGHEYKKDPTVHVVANSEQMYVFVKIENEIAVIEAETTVAEQIKTNGWTELETGIYYKLVPAKTEAQDLVVFEKFTIKGDVTNAQLDAYANKTIKVTAYAIQADGFEDNAAGAWAIVKDSAKAYGEPNT